MSVSITQEVRYAIRCKQGPYTRAELLELRNEIDTALKTDHWTEPASVLIQIVCDFFRITKDEMMSLSRRTRYTWPRQICIEAIYHRCGLSSKEVGVLFGKDHGTVLYACQQVNNRKRYGNDKKIIDAIHAAIDAQCSGATAAPPAADKPGDAGTAPCAGANGNHFSDAPHGVGLVERREAL